MTGCPLLLSAQDAKPASAPAPANAPSPPTVGESWDSLLQGAIPQATPDPVLIAPQAPVQRAPADDFANHFFLEDRTDYFRYDASFTGLATNTGIINATPTGVFNPAGYPDPAVFQPNSNRIETFLDFGTRGWLSDRVNTHFAFVYDQDLSHVDQGAPAEDILETFGSNRFLQAAEASIEIDGKPTDGLFAGTTLTVGRQYVYGAEVAAIDGVDFTFDRPSYDLTIFGGRRFTFFSDPEQRALGGADFTFKINPDVSFTVGWYLVHPWRKCAHLPPPNQSTLAGEHLLPRFTAARRSISASTVCTIRGTERPACGLVSFKS